MKWQLRLRDFFLATLIVALSIGWWLDSRRQQTLLASETQRTKLLQSQVDLLKGILEVNFRVKVDFNDDGSVSVQDLKGGKVTRPHWD